MKKCNYIFSLMTFSGLCFSSCIQEGSTERPQTWVYSENYVMCYLSEADTLYLNPEDYHDGRTKYNNGIYLFISGKDCSAHHNKEQFETLSHLYGDTKFHLSSFKGRRSASVHVSLAEQLEYISVTSDKDFDENHPAGTRLDDIVFFSAGTPFPFIKSGYKDWNERTDSYFDGGYTIIEGLLSELNPDDLVLLNTEYMYIDFPKKPKEKEQSITIRVFFKNGKVLSSTKKIIII